MHSKTLAIALCATGFALFSAVAAAEPADRLARDGAADYVIVLDADATPADQTAARELKVHLDAATGATFRITDQDPGGKAFYVGSGERFRRVVPGVDALGPDGIRIWSNGGNLYLGGEGPRGSLYAVYTFLEDVVGCRWWTPSETHIPHVPELSVPAQDVSYTPPIRMRETFYYHAFDPVFSARNRLNGHFQEIPEAYGGHYRFIGWCHTFFPILPPETYFDAHPEWYSMIDGERVADGQLCLTNLDMRAEFIENALEWVRDDPDAGMISISQNDWRRQCTCPKCAALAADEGSEAGPLLHFVNAVAEAIEAEYPDFIVETLAYQYTRQAPKHVRPRHNVAVRLCSIECDFSQPIETGPRNADFLRDIREWSEISSHLYIWNYVTNFSYYHYPHPNWDGLGPDVRLFARHKAIGVFQQGDRGSTCGDFHALRPWLQAKLLWNPDSDVDALIDEFLNGYYGAAGPYLRRYIDITREAVARADIHLGCFRRETADWLTLEDLNAITPLFDEAAAQIAGDRLLERRLDIARVPLDFVWIERWTALRREAQRDGKPFLGPEDPVAARDALLRRFRLYDCQEFGENHLVAHAVAGFDRLFEPPSAPPAQLAGLDPEDYVFRPARSMQVVGGTRTASLVPDDAAPDGWALRIPGHVAGRQVRYPIDPEMSSAYGQGQWHVLVRAETLADAGPLFAVGIHDNRGEGRTMRRIEVNAEDLSGEGYTAIRIPRERPRIDREFYVETLGDPSRVVAVYVAGVYLVVE